MATVSQEQVIQRNNKAVVAISKHGGIKGPAETFWASSTNGRTVTTDKSVAANQEDIQTVIDRLNGTADLS